MKADNYDVIVVGTGAAGLFAALHLPQDYSVLMITKDELENSDSYLAQGGICNLLGQEDFEPYYEDTLKAGRYENNPESVRDMIAFSNEIIGELLDFGVEFDKDREGNLSYTREGGHSRFRILHHQDVTGKEIVTKLIVQVKKRSNIQIEEFTTMTDVIQEEGNCRGIIVCDKEGKFQALYAKAVVLATGGLGGLFQNSTNFPHISGDSFAIALRNGIALENIHYIQIHPTVLYSKREGRRFLISESVRGEGAKLYNEAHERFVDELLPRDVVSDAIRKEMEKFGTDHVYLSLADIDKEKIMNHFPNIYQRCLEEGYDVTTEMIPVTPAQHYLMGGIKADTNGVTSMKGLYAVGETACNGVHGANRLASNSLLESLVFSRNAARYLTEHEGKGSIRRIPAKLDGYGSLENWVQENRRLLLEEIKRKDRKFYDKWCNI